MIVLDAELGSERVRSEIARWYPGAVIRMQDLRPHAPVLDPDIPSYLLRLRQPTFVTINYRDFHSRAFRHRKYCIIRLKLTQAAALFVPHALRSILNMEAFNTKAKRMGKVISWTKEGGIDYVEV